MGMSYQPLLSLSAQKGKKEVEKKCKKNICATLVNQRRKTLTIEELSDF
jgi:hypothetical protein